jgi:hypothetical protein
MKDAAAVAPATGDGWLVWDVPQKPVSVRLTTDVASRLRMAVWEGFKSLRHRGLETGGLLIGTTREVGNRVVVEIDDFEPVESQHASGPSYVLSESDRRLLEERIALRESAEVPSIVGFYRSNTRGDFAITPDDAALYANYFPAPSHVFLLIKANDEGPPTGGFIIREGGKVLSESPYAEFPLHLSTVMPAPRHEARVPVAAPVAQTSPSAARVSPSASRVVSLSPLRPSPRKLRWPVWLVAAAAVAGVALSFGILRRNPVSTPAKAGASLALNVVNTGNSLRLSWDRQWSRRASSAILWIKDGQQEHRFDLDSNQLNEGSVMYWPSNGDVNFRLELHAPGASVTESVRAIGGPSKPSGVAEPARSRLESPPARALPAQAPPVQSPPVAAHPVVQPASTNSSHAAERSRKPSPFRGTKTATPPVARALGAPRPQRQPAAIASSSLPEAPTVRQAAPEHNEELLKRIVTVDRPIGPAGDSAVHVSVAPVSGSLLEHVGRNIPLIGKRYRRPEDLVPPTPLHSAALPDAPHRNLEKPVSIDVKVYVNTSGKVDYAEVVSRVKQSDRDLAALALFSSRRWEFVPARTADGTVPGEVVLRYQFGPAARDIGSQTLVTR